MCSEESQLEEIPKEEEIIRVHELCKSYDFTHAHEWSMFGHWGKGAQALVQDDAFLALRDISFTIRRGETVGVLGKNGAGKSTLLQIITGVLQPTTGDVHVQGRVGALLELGAGFNPELTGRENAELIAAANGLSSAAWTSRMQDVIDFADIGEFIDHPVKTYSSGMLVRVAFSLQIHLDPDILIIDEALSVGDMFFQQKCTSKLKELMARGVTVFFVSHSLNAVKSLCKRALLIEKGRLVADGAAEEICEMYQNSTSSSSKEDLAVALLQSVELTSRNGPLTVILDQDVPRLPKDQFDAGLINRSGGGELRFTGFEILSSEGVSTNHLEQSACATFRLQFKVFSDLPAGTVIGLLVRDNHGVDLVAMNTDFYGLYLPEMEAADRCYTLDFQTTLPLAMGRYSFHCGAKPSVESTYFYDRCFNIGVLDILSNPASWGKYGGRLLHTPDGIRLSGD